MESNTDPHLIDEDKAFRRIMLRRVLTGCWRN